MPQAGQLDRIRPGPGYHRPEEMVPGKYRQLIAIEIKAGRDF